jgi:hypothetical protein
MYPPRPNCVNPIESLKIRWSEKQNFEISPRHYPSDRTEGDILGIRSGGVHYAFLHGQQFDREQITYSLSEAFGFRVDVVDFFEDLANISVTKKMLLVSHAGNMVLALLLLTIFMSPVYLAERMWIGVWTGIVLAILCLYCTGIFDLWRKDLPSSSTLGKIFGVLFLVDMIAVTGMWLFAPSLFWVYFLIPLIGSWYILAVMSAPSLFSFCKKNLYNWISSTRQISTKEIFKDGLFQCKKYNYNAEVLVFGHTHIPDDYLNTNTNENAPPPVLLINTGSWVSDGPGRETDSFVYIDKKGVSSMRWQNKKKEIICTKFFPAQWIRVQKKRSPSG